MNDIKNSIVAHVNWVDKFLNFELFTGKNLSEWFSPFINSITNDGAVPYLIETKDRFRASPLSSTIIWLSDAGLLPADALEIMQEKLLYLRDKNDLTDKDAGNPNKLPEDKDGWSLAEGVSVWSTSLAIIALIDICGVGVKKAGQYKSSVIWLVDQQKINEKGWAYQFYRNCDDNVIMTSLALRALSLAQQNKTLFGFSPDEERKILTALNSGYLYLKEKMIHKKTKAYSYWCFNNTPHCVATTWALIALREMSKVQNIDETVKVFYNDNISYCFKFIISRIPKGISQWYDEQIVCEGGAKYNKQKNYYSFSPTILLELLSLGISPYHPKIVNQIIWLIKNPEDWKIKEYDQEKICTFTYTMVIATLAKWISCAGTADSVHLLKKPVNYLEKVVLLMFGFPIIKDSPIQLVCKSRLWVLLFIVLAFPVIFIAGSSIGALFQKAIIYFSELYKNSSQDIINNVIGGLICAFLLTFIGFLAKIRKRAFKR